MGRIDNTLEYYLKESLKMDEEQLVFYKSQLVEAERLATRRSWFHLLMNKIVGGDMTDELIIRYKIEIMDLLIKINDHKVKLDNLKHYAK